MFLPDYEGGSILNLMASFGAALGAPSPYAHLPLLPPDTLVAPRNIVLLVVDGLGHRMLTTRNAESHLARHLKGRLTSVFPSSTASAITTFLTGLAPQQHGLVGWHEYFREVGAILAVLPFRPRHGGHALADSGVRLGKLYGLEPFFNRIDVGSHVVSPKSIVHSDFNVALSGRAQRHGYGSVDEMFQTLWACIRGSRERQYIYAYFPDLDGLAHEHGASDAAVDARFAQLDEAFERFMESVRGSDSLVIVTADHGLIDSPPSALIELDDHPELAEMLALPLCGERRVAYCYVRPGRAQDFERYLTERFGEQAALMPSADLIERHYFGPGEPHPRLHERIGDYTLIMKQNYCIKDWLLGEQRYTQLGVHGGVSEEEMSVPLIVAAA